MNPGILLAILTAFISGFSIFYNRLVVIQGIDSLIFNIYKNGGVAIILTILLILSRRIHIFRTLSKKNWMQLITIGIIGGSIPFVLFFEGLKIIPATNANLIQKTLFIWVAMFALPFLKEKLTPGQVIGYLLVVWSNIFLGTVNPLSFSKGELMIWVATILWAIEYMIAKKALKDIPTDIVTWSRMAFGSLILLGISVFQQKTQLLFSLSPSYILPITGSILFLTVYVSTLYRALAKAPATVVTSLLVLATPVTTILSTVFITKQFPPQTQLLSLAGTIVGCLVIGYFGKKRLLTN